MVVSIEAAQDRLEGMGFRPLDHGTAHAYEAFRRHIGSNNTVSLADYIKDGAAASIVRRGNDVSVVALMTSGIDPRNPGHYSAPAIVGLEKFSLGAPLFPSATPAPSTGPAPQSGFSFKSITPRMA